jgi:hypothetical protein
LIRQAACFRKAEKQFEARRLERLNKRTGRKQRGDVLNGTASGFSTIPLRSSAARPSLVSSGRRARSTAYEKLLPPLVAKVREDVKTWRDSGYVGATATSKALLIWWFGTDHLME